MIVPSRIDAGPDSPAATRAPILPRSIRCTQYVHFSITPRERTVTSGFFCILSCSAIPPSGQGADPQLVQWPLVVIEEIEPSHLVWAVVQAVARTDASVVDHQVQALVGMNRGVDGTDHFARRILALDASNRLMYETRVLLPAREITVDPDPVHLTTACDLILADDRDVVLALAGDRAGITSNACVQIDRHSPLILSVEHRRCLDLDELLRGRARAAGPLQLDPGSAPEPGRGPPS